MFKTVAAFSTGDGGTMVFGIDPDELTVTGLHSRRDALLRLASSPRPQASDTHLARVADRTFPPPGTRLGEDERVVPG